MQQYPFIFGLRQIIEFHFGWQYKTHGVQFFITRHPNWRSDSTRHGLATVINETESPYFAYNGLGKWNAYDIKFRAARFENGKLTEKALVSMYFNGKKVHVNVPINQVWGGPNSGLDGGNDGGKGITDVPGGIKLQAEGHDVFYRNIWIEELDLKDANMDF